MSNAVEKYFQEKTAGQMSFPGMGVGGMAQAGRTLSHAAGKAAIGATAAAGAAGLGMAASKIYDAITKSRDFKMMLESNDDLRGHYEQNPKLFNLAYSSLRSNAPQFGKDPLIAGEYMRRAMESPNTAGSIMREAAIDSPQRGHGMIDAFSKGSLEGAKAGLSGK